MLGQDSVNRCLSFTIGSNFVQITVLGKTINVPSKSSFESRIEVKKTLSEIEETAKKLV